MNKYKYVTRKKLKRILSKLHTHVFFFFVAKGA